MDDYESLVSQANSESNPKLCENLDHDWYMDWVLYAIGEIYGKRCSRCRAFEPLETRDQVWLRFAKMMSKDRG